MTCGRTSAFENESQKTDLLFLLLAVLLGSLMSHPILPFSVKRERKADYDTSLGEKTRRTESTTVAKGTPVNNTGRKVLQCVGIITAMEE